jgi:hypothetical protein
MSTELDIEAALAALELINENGKAAVFSNYTAATYSVSTGKVTAGSPATFNKKIIPPYPYEQKLVDGDVVRVDDMQTGVAASGLGFTPERLKTTVTIDNKIWTIVNIQPIYSGEDVALYLLQLRGGVPPVPVVP